MTDVAIYDQSGEVVDSLHIDDTIVLDKERVARGDKCFYKGVGVKYTGQYLPPDTVIDTASYRVIRPSEVFYTGPAVSKLAYEGKQGIFREPYQPMFDDFIGSCGVKELAVIENEDFARSSLKLLEVVNYDKVNKQYYFHVDYLCRRIKYLENGNPKDLYRLLEYMVQEGWNFPWDKAAINDVSFNGLVTDIADLFRSKDLRFQLGTVYAAIYSLGKLDFTRYQDFIVVNKLIPHLNDMMYVFNAAEILKRSGVDIWPLSPNLKFKEIYKYIVKEFLIEGKNCGDCCMVTVGDQIRDSYRERVKQQWKETN